MSVNNKNVIITGAAGGIGRAAALAFAKDGFGVLINYRTSEDAALALCREINEENGRAVCFRADVSARSEVDEMTDFARRELGRIGVLINNAGIAQQKMFCDITEQDFDRMMGVMIQSMTGYGKAVLTYGEKKINVEVKSLNSKTMDLSTRIAPLYREKEMEIRQMLTRKLVRGKVDFSIWIEKDEVVDAATINAALVDNYYHQIRDIAAKTGIPEPQDWFYTLLRMPDVTSRVEAVVLEPEEWAVACQAIDAAVGALIDFRHQEGAALERKFNEKIDNIERLLASIEPFEKARVQKIREQIVKGLEQLPEASYDKNRLEQELIYYIEKLDISEEKQRLTNHLKYFRETMAEDQANGKKLGFIAQEMGREINTTGSKSNQAEMQNIVVKMKDELEQIKEQVLNAL